MGSTTRTRTTETATTCSTCSTARDHDTDPSAVAVSASASASVSFDDNDSATGGDHSLSLLSSSRTKQSASSPSSEQQYSPLSLLKLKEHHPSQPTPSPVETCKTSMAALVSPLKSPSVTCKVPQRARLYRQQSSTVSEVSMHVTSGSLASGAVMVFSVYFPFILAPWAASETYHPAYYHYEPHISHFDNTAWTYGTDYFLAVCMLTLAWTISVSSRISSRPAWLSRGLLLCYGASVLAGGFAHQFFITLEDRNTWQFRALWSVCVGTVCLASIFMGCVGSELVRRDHYECESSSLGYAYTSLLPVVPEGFWIAYGTVTTVVCLLGGMSFQRPACDIFIAGITQFPSTFYMMTVLAVGLPAHPLLPAFTRVAGVLGFILNAPLLPLYPLLVQYTNWSLGTVNTLLHLWLLTAWGLQGLVLRRLEQSLVLHATPQPRPAIPVPKKIAIAHPPTTAATTPASQNRRSPLKAVKEL